MISLSTITDLFSGSGVWQKAALALGGVLLVLVLCGLAAWRGYSAGYASAEALGAAELAGLRESYASAEAAARAQALRMYDQAVGKGYAAERRYLAARRELAAARSELSNRRLSDAAQDIAPGPGGQCSPGPEWVRFYNEALGLGRGDRPVPGTSPAPAGAAGEAGTAGAGVRSGAVSQADVLAHLRDYGRWASDLEARHAALVEWVQLTREAQQ